MHCHPRQPPTEELRTLLPNSRPFRTIESYHPTSFDWSASCHKEAKAQEGADTLLRITVQEESKGVMIKLEGRLAGPWVEELHRTWLSLAPSLESKNLFLDLCDVTLVDAAGKHLLANIRRGGAGFRANTSMIKYLIEEIGRGESV